ncbi:hypothetical protein ADK38_02060, partial [Streptomyces varsoviensis]
GLRQPFEGVEDLARRALVLQERLGADAGVLAHVGARDEAAAGAGEDDRADLPVLPDSYDLLAEGRDERAGQRAELVLPVDPQDAYDAAADAAAVDGVVLDRQILVRVVGPCLLYT